LQVQTNSPGAGLGPHWSSWLNPTNATSDAIPIDPTNPGVFARLVYP
jgi:hypothetical protein